MQPRRYVKAIVAGIAAGLTALGTAIDEGVTDAEWIGIASAVVATFGAVYLAPANAASPEAAE